MSVIAALLMVLASCGDSPSPLGSDDPPRNDSPGPITSFRLLPDSAVLQPGATQQFVVSARDAADRVVEVGNVNWTVTDAAVATVDPTGLARGATPGVARVVASAAGRTDTSVVRVLAPSSGAGTIQVNSAVRLQTMFGWEATSQAGQVMCSGFDQYSAGLFDRAVNELGINRVRLEVRSGSENPQDVFTRFRAGQATSDDWRASWYVSVNDNGDPNTINPAGFHFTELNHTIENFVLPLKQRVEANGERLYINLNFVDFGTTSWDHKNSAAEYAEFMLAAFQHIRNRYGWTPDAVEVVLEPDNANWTPLQVGQALAAAGQRLETAGFRPDFIAPGTAGMGAAVTYFDQMVSVPGVLNYLKEFSYHRYQQENAALTHLPAIAQRAVQYGLRSAMLEKIGADYHKLHQDIKLGRNSSWSQYALAFCVAPGTDNGGLYYLIDNTNAAAPKVTMASRTGPLRHYFRFIRLGATRVDATSTSGALDPLAFINTDGGYTVVVKATNGSTFTVSGLPAGTYGVRYTAGSADFQAAPDVSIAAGQLLSTNIPAAGVLTIYRK